MKRTAAAYLFSAGLLLLGIRDSHADFIVNPGATVTVTNNATLDSNGSIVIQGVLDASGAAAGKVRLSGNWNKEGAGIFVPGFSTVTFYDVLASSLTGNTTFSTLVGAEPGKQLNFQAGSTQVVRDVLSLGGTPGLEVKLRSSENARRWGLQILSPKTLSFLDVKDSNAIGYTINADDSYNRGNNNANWIFQVPPTPTNVRFFALDFSSLSVTWNLAAGNSYLMVLSTSSDFATAVASGTGALDQNATSYPLLDPNRAYYFKVKISTNGDTLFSQVISTFTLPVLPVSSVTAAGVDSLTLSVTSGSNFGGSYHVQISTLSGFGSAGEPVFSATGTLPAETTTYSNLLAGATYFLRVRALWSGQPEELEHNASGYVVLSSATLPVLPSLELVSTAQSSITVLVGKGANQSPGPYEISYSTQADFSLGVSTRTLGAGSEGKHTSLSGLLPDATYYIRARALWNSAGANLLLNASGYTAVVSTGLASSTATVASAQSGNWGDPATWTGGVLPGANNPVIINAGHTVTLDQSAAAGDDVSTAAVKIFGTLTWGAPAADYTLTARGSVEVMSGGALKMGEVGSPIAANRVATLLLASTSTGNSYGLTINDGASLIAQGAARGLTTTLLFSVGAGATIITARSASEIEGWAVGDTITIGMLSAAQETEKRTIADISGVIITLGSPLTYGHFMGSPLANLTRNVVIRGSDTAKTGYILNQNNTSLANFDLDFVQLSYLGRNRAGQWGVTFGNGTAFGGTLDNCSLHEGYFGLYLDNASSNRFSNNLVYGNTSPNAGIYQTGGSSNSFLNNHAYGNSSNGIYLLNADRNVLTGNRTYGNGSHGVNLYNSDGNDLTSNRSHSNAGSGFIVQYSRSNRIANSEADYNGTAGFTMMIESSDTVHSNLAHGNLANGIFLNDSRAVQLSGNRSYDNGQSGFYVEAVRDAAWISNYSYANVSAGFLFRNSYGIVIDNSSIGYDAFGGSAPNGIPIAFPSDDNPKAVVLKNSKINGTIGNGGMNRDGNYLLSYRHDQAAGEARLWGDYRTFGSTLTLEYAYQLYGSTHTLPRLMRGSGHSASVMATNDASAKSELVTILYRAADGVWIVSGTLSGGLGSFTGSQSGWTPPGALFTLDFIQGPSPQDSDAVDFVTFAAAGDANVQKKLSFGAAASGWNGGRSRLTINSSGTFKAIGDPSFPTQIDWIGSGNTYYTLISSGSALVRLQEFYVAHVDTDGFKFIANPSSLTIQNGTFDYGMSAGSTNTYIQLSSVTTAMTLSGVSFADSGGASPSSVRVTGDDAGLNWLFINWGGARGGELNDFDPNDRIHWDEPTPPANVVIFGVDVASVSVQWDLEAGNSYRMSLSTSSDFTVTTASGVGELNQNTTSYFPLLGNNTYYFRVKRASVGDAYYSAGVSTITYPTLASSTITVASTNSITLIVSSGANSGGEYGIEISTGPSFDPSLGVSVFSATGTLADGATTYGGLLSGATYFVRVRTIWGGHPQDWTANASGYLLLSTATMPVLPSIGVFGVDSGSISFIAGRGGNNDELLTEISFSTSSNFRTPVSTVTSVSSSPVSISEGLLRNATYFIRARALWNSAGANLLLGASGYTPVISTVTPPALAIASVTVTSSNSITLVVSSGTNRLGRYHVQIATGASFDPGLGFDVFSATRPLSSSPTTYAGLLRGATYFLRVRTLWDGQQDGLEQNASGYVTLSTATMPVLPSIGVFGVDSGSISFIAGRGGNNDELLTEISFSTSSNFRTPVSTVTSVSSSPVSISEGLLRNATYFIRARALWNSAGDNLLLGASGYTPVISTVTPPALAIASVTVTSSNSITLVVSSGTNRLGRYHVQIATGASFDPGLGFDIFNATRPLSSSPTTYAGLLRGATYFVRVRTLWNGQQDGLEQNASGYVTLSTATRPVLPSIGVFGVDSGSVTFITGRGGNNDGLLTEISFSTSSNFRTPVSTITAVSDVPVSISEGLLRNATYFIRARALWNSAGDNLLLGASGYTPVISTVTPPALAIASITVTSSNSITLVVSSGTNRLGRYHVQIATGASFDPGLGFDVFNATRPLSSSPTTYAGLLRGATYFLRVRTLWNGQQDGLEQNASGYVLLSTATRPVLPSLSLIAVDRTSITVMAGRGGNNDELLAEISVSTSNNFAAPVTTITALSSAAASFTGLSEYTSHYVRARAIWNAAGENLLLGASGYSPVLIVQTQAAPPPAGVRFFAVNVGSASAVWDLATGNAYTMAISTASDFSVASSSGTGGLDQNSTSYVLIPNATYYFRVKVSSGLETTYSSPVSTVTLPALAVASVTAAGGNSLTLVVTSGTNAGGQYHLEISTRPEFSGEGVEVRSATGALSASATTFGDLLLGATYFLRARALWGGQQQGLEQGASGYVTASTSTLPGLPSLSWINVEIGSFSFITGPGANHDALLTEISYSTSSDFRTPVSTLTAVSSSPVSVSAGLADNTTYFLRARALWNSAGDNLLLGASGFTPVLATATWSRSPGIAGYEVFADTSVIVYLAPNGNHPLTSVSISTGMFEAESSSSGVFGVGYATLTITNLNPLYSYQLKARTVNFGNLPSSVTPVVSFGIELVNNVHFIGVTADSVTAQWDAIGGNAYTMAISSRTDFSFLASSGTAELNQYTTSYSSLRSNTTYYFKVKLSTQPDGAYGTPISILTYALTPSLAEFQVFTTSISATLHDSGNQVGTLFSISTGNFEASSSSTGALAESRLTLTLENLVPNATYSIQAQATGFTGFASMPAVLITTVTLPAVPGISTFTEVWLSSLTLTWDPSGNPLSPPTSYQVQISTSADFAQSSSSFTFNLSAATATLAPNTSYYFRVRATGVGGDSAYNPAVSTTTLAAPPGSSGFQVFAGSITARFDLNGNPEGTILALSTGNFSASSSSSGAAAELTLSGLTGNATYPVLARAVNRWGLASATFTFTASTTTLAYPPAAAGFQIYATSIAVTFEPGGNREGTRIAISTGSGGFEVARSSKGIVAGANTALAITGLSTNTFYAFQAGSLNPTGSTNTVTLTASTATWAAVPTLSSFSAVYRTSVTFGWQPNGNPLTPPTSYEVQISTWGGFEGTVTSSVTYNLYTSSEGLSTGGTYFARVRAFNRLGDPTGFSAAISTTTGAYVPVPDLFSAAQVALSSIAFSWNANGNTPDTLYRVQVSTDMGFSLYSASETATLSVSSETLLPNTTYHFRVAASPFAEFSGTISTATLAAAPGLISFDTYSTTISVRLAGNGNPTGTWMAISTGDFQASASSAATYDSGVLSLAFFNLVPNSPYTVQFRAVNHHGIASSATLLAGPVYTLPNPPLQTTIGQVSDSTMTVTWSNNANPLTPPTSYQVQISSSPDFSGDVLSSSETFALSAASATLLSNTSYYFRVRAFGVGGTNSGFDGAVSTYTLAAAPAFAGFDAFITSISVRLLRGADAAGTQVRARAYSDNFTVLQGSTQGAADLGVTTLTVLSIPPNTVYNFAADAFNHWGLVSTQTLSLATATLPQVPGDFSFTLSPAEVGATSITIRWDNNGNPLTPPTSYQLEISTWEGFEGTLTSSITYNVFATTAGLSPEGTYYFRVRAFGVWGATSAFNAAVSTAARDNVPPAALTALSALTGSAPGTVQLQWIAPGDNGFTGQAESFDIRYTADSGFDWNNSFGAAPAVNTALPASGPAETSETLLVENLDPGVTYYFRIKTRDGAGNVSDLSVGATTYAGPAGPVSMVLYLRAGALSAPYPAASNALSLSSAGTDNTATQFVSGNAASVPKWWKLNPEAAATDQGNALPATITDQTWIATTSLLYQSISTGPMSLSLRWKVSNTGISGRFAWRVSKASVTGSAFFNPMFLTGGTNNWSEELSTRTASAPNFPQIVNIVSTVTTSTTFMEDEALVLELAFRQVGASNNNTFSLHIDTPSARFGTPLIGDATAPMEVTGLAALTGPASAQIRLSWTSPGNNNGIGRLLSGSKFHISSTTVEGDALSGGYWAGRANTPDIVIATSDVRLGDRNGTVAADLQDGVTYFFRIWTMDNAGNLSAISNGATAQAQFAARVPSAATATQVNVASITVTWGQNGNGPGVLYELQASTSQDFVPYSSSVTYSLSADTAALAPNTSYYFQVRTFGVAGDTSAFNAAIATFTLAAVPLTAASTYTVVTASSIAVEWMQGSNPPGTLYLLETSTSQDFVGETQTSSRTYSLFASSRNLTEDTSYFFRVTAVNHNNLASNPLVLGGTRTIFYEIGVIILGTDSFNFGLMDLDASAVTGSSFTIRNAGNTAQDYLIRATTATADTPWALGGAAGMDRMVLWGGFSQSPPATGDFGGEDILGYGDQTSSASRFAIGADNGAAVPALEDRYLWLRLSTPLMTSTTSQQSIQVTITGSKTP